MEYGRKQTADVRNEEGFKHENAPITVIGCAPDGDDRLIEHEFIPFHRKLVGSSNKINAVIMCKFLRYICTKKKSRSPGREAPSCDIWRRLRRGREQERISSNYRLGPTTKDHTSARHVELLVSYQ